MRSKFRSGLVLLVAALALSVVASATASAATPEIVGKSGKELVKKKFTSTIGSGRLEGYNGYGSATFCEKGTGAGEVKGLQGGELTLTLGGCSLNDLLCKTHGNPGKNKELGEIYMPLPVKLVYLKKAAHSLALLYSLPSGGLTIFCGEAEYKLSGSFLIAPGEAQSNKLKTEFTTNLSSSGYGETYSHYENEKGEEVYAGLEMDLVGSAGAPVGWSFTGSMKFEEEAELKG